MKKILQLSINSYLIILMMIYVSCNKDDDFGKQPYESYESEESNSLSTSIILEIDGFDNQDGDLAIAIFNNKEDFESNNTAFKDSTLSIDSYIMEVNINNIDAGEYVISVFHDADENGELTLNSFLGFDIPQEGFGFSNNPSIGFSQPSYNDCKFTITEQETMIVPITLNYF